MPENDSHRTSRWERKLATLEPGSEEYTEHLKSMPEKPAQPSAAPKKTLGGRRAGKAAKRKTAKMWGTFKLLPRQC